MHTLHSIIPSFQKRDGERIVASRGLQRGSEGGVKGYTGKE